MTKVASRAVTRDEITTIIDADAVTVFLFAGIDSAVPGNQMKTFKVGYRPAKDVVVPRRATDAQKRAVIKLINESRRAKEQLIAAKANGAAIKKGRPLQWQPVDGADPLSPSTGESSKPWPAGFCRTLHLQCADLTARAERRIHPLRPRPSPRWRRRRSDAIVAGPRRVHARRR